MRTNYDIRTITAEEFRTLSKDEKERYLQNTRLPEVVVTGFTKDADPIREELPGTITHEEYKKIDMALKMELYQVILDIYNEGRIREANQYIVNVFSAFVVSRIVKYHKDMIDKFFYEFFNEGIAAILASLKKLNLHRGAPTTLFDLEIKNAMSSCRSDLTYGATRHYTKKMQQVKEAINYFEVQGLPYTDVAISVLTGLSVSNVNDAIEQIHRHENRCSYEDYIAGIYYNPKPNEENARKEDVYMDTPESIAIERERHELLRDGLLGMQEINRRLFCMRHFMKMPVDPCFIKDLSTIADFLNISLEKCVSLFGYAREKMQMLQEKVNLQKALYSYDKVDHISCCMLNNEEDKLHARLERKIYCMYYGLEDPSDDYSVVSEANGTEIKRDKDIRSYESIAMEIGLPLSEVKGRIQQATKSLKYNPALQEYYAPSTAYTEKSIGFHKDSFNYMKVNIISEEEENTLDPEYDMFRDVFETTDDSEGIQDFFVFE